MSFAERLLRRRRGLDDITGFAGGTLGDQLDEENPRLPPDRMSGIASTQAAQPTMADQYMATAQPVTDLPDNRPRQVNPFQQRLMQGRQRVADPTGFDVQHLRDLESAKDPRWEKILNATAAGIASAAQGGAPIKPIPTRRERDIATVGGRVGQDLELDKQRLQGQAIQSQIGSREAAQQAAEERIRQGDLRLQQGQSRLDQSTRNQRRMELIRQHSGFTDFDPSDPKNADFVQAWTNEFGYAPQKQVRGSQYGYRQGYDASGNVIAEVYNKGTGAVTPIQGSSIATTEGQQNRAQREQQFTTAEAGRNQRAMQSQSGANQRAGMRQGSAPVDRTTARKAAELVGTIDAARSRLQRIDAQLAQRPNDSNLKQQREQIQTTGEQAAGQLNALGAGYEAGPGTQGYPYYKKSEQAPQTQGQPTGGSFNLGAWKADHPNATDQEVQAQRSKAKARNLAIVE